MQRLITALFIVAGIVKLLPVVGVLGAEQLEALYDLRIRDPDLLLLMRHRAVLFGVVGGLLVTAALRPSLRVVAASVGLVSIASFLLLALPLDEHGAALRRVFWADVVAGSALLLALWLSRRAAR